MTYHSPRPIDETKIDMKTDLKPGDIVDVHHYDDVWRDRYGVVERIEEDGIVWTMRYQAHDGCCWSYKHDFKYVRLSKEVKQ